MSLLLSPSSLFPVEEADTSDCEHCDKFDRRLVELRNNSGQMVELRNNSGQMVELRNNSGPTWPETATAAAPADSKAQSKKSQGQSCCSSNLIIDCTCLDPRPKPTKLYYCCCINLRCSASAWRALLFVLAFGLISAGILSAICVVIWGVVVGRDDARNFGIAGFGGGILVLVYACCVASRCQANRKTRELWELAQQQHQLQYQQLQHQHLHHQLQQQSQDRRRLSARQLSSSGNGLAIDSSQPSLWAEDAQQQTQKKKITKKKTKPKSEVAIEGKTKVKTKKNAQMGNKLQNERQAEFLPQASGDLESATVTDLVKFC